VRTASARGVVEVDGLHDPSSIRASSRACYDAALIAAAYDAVRLASGRAPAGVRRG